MQQALEGMRILDLGNYIAAPYAAMLLGDQGADVIKVERRGGDPYRKIDAFVVLNRGKRSITLDLKQAEGQKIARDLAKQSDVLLENFKPGVADSFKMGYSQLSQLNPRLVYCSMSGFGEKGPYRDKPGYDPIVESMACIFTDQGTADKPVYVVLPLASGYAALMSAFSVTTALLARETTGSGQLVEMPLLNAMVATGTAALMTFPNVMRMMMSGDLDLPMGLGMPLYGLHKCKDGEWLFLALGNPGFWTKFAVAVDHADWLVDPTFENAPMLLFPPKVYDVQRLVDELFLTRTREEWIDFLWAQEIPCAPAKRVDEYLDDPQIQANEMVVEIEEHKYGKVREIGIPVKMSLTPGKIKGPSPRLGEHTNEILAELGYSTRKIEELREKKVV